MNSKYICYNGRYAPETDKLFTVGNRAFAYGDGLFETIHCEGTAPQFLEKHLARLLEGLRILGMEPGELSDVELVRGYIGKLLNKNRIFKGARIRLTVFRAEGGHYTPVNREACWTMQATALAEEQYVLNTSGLHIDIFDTLHKPVNRLSPLKTTNALIYVLAGIFKQEQGLDECIILNQFGRVAETISSNIFIFLENRIFTPPLTEGCIAGTMRNTMFELARNTGYELAERPLFEQQVFEAEEVFLTNAIHGIQWVAAYKDRRYFNFVSRKLIAALNELAFS